MTTISKWLWTGLFIFISIVILKPYFGAGVSYDDITNGMTQYRLDKTGVSIWATLSRSNHAWIVEKGRFFPMAHLLEIPTYYYFMGNVLVYRFFSTFFVLVNLLLFANLITRLSKNFWLGLLGSLIALLCFQARNYYDPITGFGYLLQYVCIFGLSSLLFLLKFKETHLTRYLILSLLFHSFAVLSYEAGICFSLTLCISLFDWQALKKRNWKALIPYALHFLILGVYLLTCFYFRAKYTAKYDGTQFSFSVKAFRTFFNQFSGAFPLTYMLFARSGVFKWSMLKSMISFENVVCFVGFFLFIRQIAYRINQTLSEKLRPSISKTFFVNGFFLALVPPGLICLSFKYQEQILRPGMAYIPVYLSYFGAALWILGVSVRFVSKQHRKKRTWFWPAFMSLLLVINSNANQLSISFENSYSKYPRALFEEALQEDLFKDVPNGGLVLFIPDVNTVWMLPEMLEQYSKRSIRFSNLHLFVESPENTPERLMTDPVYFINAISTPGEKESYLVFSRVGRVTSKPRYNAQGLLERYDPTVLALGHVTIFTKDNKALATVIYGQEREGKRLTYPLSFREKETETGSLWQEAFPDFSPNLFNEPVNQLAVSPVYLN